MKKNRMLSETNGMLSEGNGMLSEMNGMFSKTNRTPKPGGCSVFPRPGSPILVFVGKLDFLGIYINSASNHHYFYGNTTECHLLMEDRFNNNLGLFWFLFSYK